MTTTVDVQEEKNIYLSNFVRFEKAVARDGQSWVHRLRKAAMKRFSELGFPGPRDEDWKFTNVAPLAKIPFRPVTELEADGLTREKVAQLVPPVPGACRLVFVNGLYASGLSSPRELPAGVLVTNLATAIEKHQTLVEPHLAKYARYQDLPFTALNTAFLRDGAFVSVPRNLVLDVPVELVFVATTAGEGSVSHPRNLILAGEHSQLTLVETYVGLEDKVSFTNVVTEIVAGPSAVVDHYKVQREGLEAFHVANTQIYMQRASNVRSHYVSLGGGLVRNESRALLDDEGCECTLNGLYLADGRQHIDNHTVIDHAKPHCASHELYKGILGGKSHGVFNGKIFVRQDAQKTDAKQTNQTLLLSEDAVIDTKPQLEIYADDVKCTHGATVGQLRAEEIFYLRSRGIDETAARNLLTFAFANDIIGRIQVASLREQLEAFLVARQGLPRPAKEGL